MSEQAAITSISPLMKELAAYIAAAPRRALPKAATEATKHHLLDTLAAMVSGAKLLPGKAAIKYVRSLGGNKEATIVGTRLMTNVPNAALVNGMTAHADETDDSHAASSTHPGCGIIPAALALAERNRASGTALLRAIALGYDVSARLSISLGAAHFRRVGHLTHCFGPNFGAAAAGAALCGLSANQVRHVLSYASQQACGISTYPRDTEHIEKAFVFGGMPARNGATAATLVASGCTAVDDVFSGERNFYIAYDESARTGVAPRPEEMIRDLGKTYEICNTNIKRWTVGSPIQAPLDSLHELIRTHAIRAEDVDKVVVRVSKTGAATVNNREMPDINMQHMCAVMLLDGTATFASAHDLKRMKDRRVLALRAKIELIGDEELEKRLPSRQGIVEIALQDGRTLRHHTEHVRGTFANPMTRAEVDEKCYALMVPVLGARRARALCASVWTLEKFADVRKLRPLLHT
jgi:2-methylcitrate dehydratase PrpD